MANDFKNRTLSGLRWSLISQFVIQALNFLIGIALARLLTPKDFGLMGMIFILVGFASIFQDLGFGAALIQKKDAQQKHFSTIFWINIGTGLLIMSIIILSAPWIAGFYKEPALLPLAVLLSATISIGSIGSIQRTLFQKELNFQTMAIVDIAAMILSGGVAIVMALSGFGVWSLAVKAVLGTAISIVVLWFLSDWRPSFMFDWGAAKELLGFSGNLLGFTILNYFIRNTDKLLIGRVLGSSALGLYDKAYSLMLFPLSNISSVVGRVMFPAFSSVQEDRQLIKRTYLRMTRSIALITFPLMCGLLVVSDHFVIAVFGLQWVEMIPLLQVFCIVGMIQSIGTLNGNIYLSQGRSDLQFKVGGTVGVLGVIAIIIGLRWGIKGVAYAYTIFTLLAIYPSIKIAVSLVGLKFRDVVTDLSGIFGCASIMAAAVWLLGLSLPQVWPQWGALMVQVPFGIIVYMLFIHIFKVQGYVEIRALVKEQWKKQLKPVLAASPGME